jgi:large subunit ribosomal protein LP0
MSLDSESLYVCKFHALHFLRLQFEQNHFLTNYGLKILRINSNIFQVLQIPTKIVKGQIEITNEVKLIKKGDKVGSSEAALLQKLNIKPFSYGFGIDCIYDNGACFSVDVLDIDNDILTARFGAALKKVASISLAIGYPTQASIPHSIGNAFKSLVAITVNLDNYSFPKAKPFKDYLADPSAFACAAPAAAPKRVRAKKADVAAPADKAGE